MFLQDIYEKEELESVLRQSGMGREEIKFFTDIYHEEPSLPPGVVVGMEDDASYRRLGPVSEAMIGMIIEENYGRKVITYRVGHAEELRVQVN